MYVIAIINIHLTSSYTKNYNKSQIHLVFDSYFDKEIMNLKVEKDYEFNKVDIV